MSRETMQTQHFQCRKTTSVASHTVAKKWDPQHFILQASPSICLQVTCIPISWGLSSLYLHVRDRFLHLWKEHEVVPITIATKLALLSQTKNIPWQTTASSRCLQAYRRSQIISGPLFLITTNSLILCEALLPCKRWKAWTRSCGLAHKSSSYPRESL